MNRPAAIITGASTGIGKALSIKLSDRYFIYLISRDIAKLQKVVDEISAKGNKCQPIVADVSKQKSILTSNTPISIAAASIYMATIVLNIESKIPKSDIAKVAKTSQVTIGKCYKELLKFKNTINSDPEIKKYLQN